MNSSNNKIDLFPSNTTVQTSFFESLGTNPFQMPATPICPPQDPMKKLPRTQDEIANHLLLIEMGTE